jgi:hypothetical protein
MVSRIQPLIFLDFPEKEEELEILKYNVDFAPADLLELTVNFLQQAHHHNLNYSTRDGINIMRFALKLKHAQGTEIEAAFHQAVTQILGEGAENFEARASGLFFPKDVKDLGEFMTTEGDLEEDDDEDEDEDDDDDASPEAGGGRGP